MNWEQENDNILQKAAEDYEIMQKYQQEQKRLRVIEIEKYGKHDTPIGLLGKWSLISTTKYCVPSEYLDKMKLEFSQDNCSFHDGTKTIYVQTPGNGARLSTTFIENFTSTYNNVSSGRGRVETTMVNQAKICKIIIDANGNETLSDEPMQYESVMLSIPSLFEWRIDDSTGELLWINSKNKNEVWKFKRFCQTKSKSTIFIETCCTIL